MRWTEEYVATSLTDFTMKVSELLAQGYDICTEKCNKVLRLDGNTIVCDSYISVFMTHNQFTLDWRILYNT